VIGRCAGGCDTDADCPAGACDATTRRCTRACNRSGSCFSSSSTSTTSAWLCDVARGGCTFYTTKKMGDPCNWPGACFCTSGALDVVGMCSRACRPGEDCGASFVCDALVPPEVALLEQPRELLGMCRRICTADADCGGEVCGASGGLKVKTCRPKW
jgi:hypothetical protein